MTKRKMKRLFKLCQRDGTLHAKRPYFDNKRQAKLHRDDLNATIGSEVWHVRRGPDHWKGEQDP